MAILSVLSIAECLGKSLPLSLIDDIFGVRLCDNDNQTNSLKDQLSFIQDTPFVRVGFVTIQGATSNVQRDLGVANEIYQRECNVCIISVGSIVVDLPNLLVLDQDDCNAEWAEGGHSVSDDEDELFNLGRDMGADIVCYYISYSTLGTSVLGCAAHPPGRLGFWVSSAAVDSYDFIFAHELTHVLSDVEGVSVHSEDRENLMYWNAGRVKDFPLDLDEGQISRIQNNSNVGCN